jgi:hypothetical protein
MKKNAVSFLVFAVVDNNSYIDFFIFPVIINCIALLLHMFLLIAYYLSLIRGHSPHCVINFLTFQLLHFWKERWDVLSASTRALYSISIFYTCLR